MREEIKVPSMGESITEATIGTMLKTNGSHVSVEDELIELETEKVNQVLYAQYSGEITWNVASEETVKIGQVIGWIDTEKEGVKQTVKTVEIKVPPSSPSLPPAQEGARVSKEAFVADLKGTKVPEKAAPVVGARNETRKKMSKVRKAIANRLVDVMRTTAMLTTFNEVDMTNIVTLREKYKEEFMKRFNVRLGFMPFFVNAAVSAMKAFPEINAYIDGDDIVYREYFDIGIAVGTDKGLFVPVVRRCDQISFADIEHSIEDYAKKAREGKLIPGDLQGGGFTITNGGTYGSLLSTPILNPPQSAILGMHKIMKRPVVINDEIVIRQMMYLALSYDHRVVDGKEAVSFLVHVKNMLEDPTRLVIGI